jgi:hypothetical protein
MDGKIIFEFSENFVRGAARPPALAGADRLTIGAAGISDLIKLSCAN